MKKWKDNWPFLGAILLTIASVDWVIIPFILEPMGLSFWTTFWITTLLANLEIIGWFYFWRWFAWTWLPQTEPIKDTIELKKNVVVLLEEYGLLETITYKVRETFRWATNPDRVRSLKKWGHFWMLFLGAEPFFSGGRLLGVVSCTATRWKAGLISLCIGNVAHVYISIKTWKLTFYLWEQYQSQFIIFLVIFTLLFFARSFVLKKLKRESLSKSP